ncbi:MAG: DUF4163 domain-containing protein [Candidatus Sphingomonas colombiensis]|nr:DUF4163 domain-containing protein [Sphingomonas sp.]WEK41720.1 MAG: DUF4163 domain-containing protein [Sphingomonas sp.]
MRIAMGLALTVSVATGALAQSGGAAQDYKFLYGYPPAAARIPALRTWLEADSTKLRAATARDAAEARRQARKSGFPYRKYETQKTWQLVTNTQRFISLSGKFYSYTGGAHGNSGSLGMLWDKATGRRLEPKQVFTSIAALHAAVTAPFCAALNSERTSRRGAAPSGDGTFDKCPNVDELTLLLGSSNGSRINRIGLIADPYVAGPYAEGSYEVTLPVTPVLLNAVKPAYRAAFEIGR